MTWWVGLAAASLAPARRAWRGSRSSCRCGRHGAASRCSCPAGRGDAATGAGAVLPDPIVPATGRPHGRERHPVRGLLVLPRLHAVAGMAQRAAAKGGTRLRQPPGFATGRAVAHRPAGLGACCRSRCSADRNVRPLTATRDPCLSRWPTGTATTADAPAALAAAHAKPAVRAAARTAPSVTNPGSGRKTCSCSHSGRPGCDD